MKVRTSVKAGGLSINRCETVRTEPSRFQIMKLEDRIAPQAAGRLLGEINKDDPLTTGSQDRDGSFGQTYCASQPHPGGEKAETLGVLFG